MTILPVTIGTFEGLGPLGKVSELMTDEGYASQFDRTISVTIGVLTVSAGIWFIVQIFSGAFQWLSSGGDKQAVQNAAKRIQNAMVGLFAVVVAYAVISIVGLIFGLDILNPGEFIRTINSAVPTP